MSNSFSNRIPVWVFGLVLLIMAVAGFLLSAPLPMAAWLIQLALLAAFIVAAGYNVKGVWRGCFIDDRNKISLSRLQMIAWTLLVLSAYLSAVMINIRAGVADPLAVAVPEELWILMGISTTSLVGSPLLLNQKRVKPFDNEALDEQNQKLTSRGESEIRAVGQIACRDSVNDVQWSDLFRGEDVNNIAYLDISRVQMFYFTFILLLAYGYTIGAELLARQGGLADEAGIETLPAVSGGMLALLGISHTAYLANKSMSSASATGAADGPSGKGRKTKSK